MSGLADKTDTPPVASAPAPADTAAWLAQGRYVLRRPLAQGGMGRVYLVYDHELEREVALKVLLPEAGADPTMVATFVEEARAVGQLEHPAITPVYDLGVTPDDQLYFTMKYLNGETMADLILRLREADGALLETWSFSRRLELIVTVAEALSFAHQRGVLHRDIKPSNIMVGPAGEVTVMDWGLAKRARTVRAPMAGHETSITRRGEHANLSEAVAGTPGYLAPEALESASGFSPQSDVYSLGVVMHELFALHPPFPELQPMERQLRSMAEDPPFIDASRTAQGRVPREIAIIVSKAVRYDPQDRYASIEQMLDAIRQYQRGEAPVVCVHTGLKRGVNRLSKLVDEHGHLVIVILAILLTTPLIILLMWWLSTRV
jgi:serine/threonine-protein kinase